MGSSTAVLFVRLNGAPMPLQEAACLEYCQRLGYTAGSLCYHPTDAAAVVEAGIASIIVAAYRRSEDRVMERRAQAAGGRVEYSRQPVGVRHEVDSDDLVTALHERGATVEQIADLLGESTQAISRTLSGPRK